MAKVTIGEVIYEGTPEEIKKLMGEEKPSETMGVIFKDAYTDEFKKAKAELARLSEKTLEEKWAKIGREPNEFKKGDIVRVEDPCGANLQCGELVEVNSDSYGYDSVAVEGEEFPWYVVVSELVAPVESRFDKDSE